MLFSASARTEILTIVDSYLLVDVYGVSMARIMQVCVLDPPVIKSES